MHGIARSLALLAIAFATQCVVVRGSEDPTYWDTHSLVYAEVGNVVKPEPGKPAPSVELKPLLTLSGHFDAGTTPRIVSRVDTKNFGDGFRLPAAGQMVLVVVVKTGQAFRVDTDRASFMPSDHAPICVVKDFDDPKVSETFKAVQKLRRRTDAGHGGANPGDDATKH